MGAEARWVCHTCKTVCSPGGRPMLRTKAFSMGLTRDRIEELRSLVDTVNLGIDMGDDADSILSFLSDLSSWLSRHETHMVHVGSDYTTDAMDLDSYRNESVDGKVSDATRLELKTRGVSEWRVSRMKEIAKVIRKHDHQIRHGNVDTAANELYQLFEKWGLTVWPT